MAQLRAQDGVAAKALEFAILTAARTGEVLGATLGEIDGNVWTIPQDRMKGGREHRVPLSRQALAIIDDAGFRKPRVALFPGPRGKLSKMAMLAVLKRMGCDDWTTVHGFRSTFRDWAAEQTAFPNEVVEMALAHIVSDKTEAAYRRGDLFEKRRRLMGAWADYCLQGRATADVTPLRAVR
jgi:integrase